ncbi:uncharacterized protein LOC143299813 [Babylonia areolata]|uniref:uncharacterized protein LOC143299813 n=1 Tax=Babylonia areolata TaxID=304850 RepID=UPI003FD5D4A0
MASRQRRIQQLQENIMIRSSLLLRQAEEFKINLSSCVNETHSGAMQCVSSVGQNQVDVQKLQDTLKKVEKVTEVIANLNSTFFDLLESSSDGETEQQTGPEPAPVAPQTATTQGSLSPSPPNNSSDNDAGPRQHPLPQSEGAGCSMSQPQMDITPMATLPALPALPASSVTAAVSSAFPLLPTAAGVGTWVPPAVGNTLAPVTASAGQAPLQGSGLVGVLPQSLYAPTTPHLSSSSLTAPLPPSMGGQSAATTTASVRTVIAATTVPPVMVQTSCRATLDAGDRGEGASVTAEPSVRSKASVRSCGPSSMVPAGALPPSVSQPIGVRGCSPPDLAVIRVAQENPLGQDRLRLVDSPFRVLVTHVDNPWSFYIVQCQHIIRDLNKQINHHVWQTWETLNRAGIGSLCLAQFKDGVFYRAQVQHIYPDSSATVYFVDYGNVFITKVSQLLVLPEHLRELPALAIHCCLSEVAPSSKTGAWTQRAIDEFQELVTGEDVLCRPLPLSRVYRHLPVLVELYLLVENNSGCPVNKSIREFMTKGGMARPVLNETLLSRLEESHLNSQLGQPTPVSHQPVSDTASSGPQIPPATNSSQQSCTSLPVPSADREVDYSEAGKMLSQHQLRNILRRLPKMNVSRRRTECEMKASGDAPFCGDTERRQSVGSHCSGENERGSMEAVSGDMAAINSTSVVHRNGDTGDSDALATYQTLFQSLTGSSDYTSFEAMVATVISPTDFYVHRVCPETGHLLDNLTTELGKMFSKVPRASLRNRSRKLEAKPGVLCCAQFQDEVFYRGLIKRTEMSESSLKRVQVFFMDFGDTAWVPRTQVYPLPPDFHSVDPQAIWCSLAYVRPLSSERGEEGGWQWEERTVREFERLVGGDRVFQVLAAGHLPPRSNRGDAVQTSPLQVIMEDREEGQVCINHDLIVRNFAAPNALTPSQEANMMGVQRCEGRPQFHRAKPWVEVNCICFN